MSMAKTPCHRVDFLYIRRVSVYIGGTEDEILDFLTDNPEWHPLGVATDIVDKDVSEPAGDIDFEIWPEARITPLRKLVDGKLVEADS